MQQDGKQLWLLFLIRVDQRQREMKSILRMCVYGSQQSIQSNKKMNDPRETNGIEKGANRAIKERTTKKKKMTTKIP